MNRWGSVFIVLVFFTFFFFGWIAYMLLLPAHPTNPPVPPEIIISDKTFDYSNYGTTVNISLVVRDDDSLLYSRFYLSLVAIVGREGLIIGNPEVHSYGLERYALIVNFTWVENVSFANDTLIYNITSIIRDDSAVIVIFICWRYLDYSFVENGAILFAVWDEDNIVAWLAIPIMDRYAIGADSPVYPAGRFVMAHPFASPDVGDLWIPYLRIGSYFWYGSLGSGKYRVCLGVSAVSNGSLNIRLGRYTLDVGSSGLAFYFGFVWLAGDVYGVFKSVMDNLQPIVIVVGDSSFSVSVGLWPSPLKAYAVFTLFLGLSLLYIFFVMERMEREGMRIIQKYLCGKTNSRKNGS